MKKRKILTLLRKGFIFTNSFTVKELEDYMFILKGLFEEGYLQHMIKCSNNPFWWPDNNKNRNELYSDIKSMRRKSVQDLAYFRIINRFANGDKYGIITY